MKGPQFKKLVAAANETVQGFISTNKLDVVKDSKPPIDIPIRSFIADTVPGRGPALKLATNPVFAGEFAGAVQVQLLVALLLQLLRTLQF